MEYFKEALLIASAVFLEKLWSPPMKSGVEYFPPFREDSKSGE